MISWLSLVRNYTITCTSVYHLNGIFGSFFWANGTALFSTKETKQIEPYHLIGIFRCQWAGLWVHIMSTRNMVAELPMVLSNDLENCFPFLEKKATISSFGCCSIQISSGKPAISIHIVFPQCSSGGSTLEAHLCFSFTCVIRR